MGGGVGTLDEVFEAATLIETKEEEKFRISLVCSEYWRGKVEGIEKTMRLENNHISKEEVSGVRMAETKEEGIGIIEKFQNNDEMGPKFKKREEGERGRRKDRS
jgi:Predicted Rossmann fold nucleotide-binding protein